MDSIAAPFGTLSGALSVATADSVVLVAAGTYPERVSVPAGVRVEGACAAEVVLTSTDTDWNHGVLDVGGPDVEIAHLSVVGSALPGVLVETGASVTLAGVSLRQTSGAAVLALGGAAIFDGVVVDGVGTDPRGTFGRALVIENGGTAEVRATDIRRTGDVGISVGPRSTLTIEDSVVRNSAGGRSFGRGLEISADASAAVRRVLVDHTIGAGILVGRGPTTGAGPTVEMEQVVIRDVLPEVDGAHGRGLEAQTVGSLVAHRLLIQRARDAGAIITGEVPGELEDLVIADIESEMSTGEDGSGVVVQIGGLSVRRALLVRASDIGLVGLQADVEMEDVTIADTKSELGTNLRGRGLSFQDQSTLTARRVSIHRTAEVGVFVAGTDATLEDVLVDGVVSDRGTGRSGRGLSISDGSTVTLTRVAVRDVRDFGIFTLGSDIDVMATHVSVHSVHTRDCVSDGCTRHASGVLAAPSATITLDSFEVAEAELCGLMVLEGGALDVSNGVVRDAEIGACVQADGYDLGRLQRGVIYRGNGVNLDSLDLPLPEADPPTDLESI